MIGKVTFDNIQFNRIFPFYILFGKDLIIDSTGETLEKLFPGSIGKSFNDSYEVVRPQVETNTFESINSLSNQMIVIECKNKHRTNLRGQIEWIEEQESYLFIGSPWFESIEKVIENKLSINDFALHDPMIDLLHLLKTQEITTEDLKHLLNTVNKQKNDLKNAAKEIEDIALFPTQNPDPIIRIDKEGNIMSQNPAAINLTHFIYNECKYPARDFWKIVVNKLDFLQERIIIEAESEKEIYSFIIMSLPKSQYFNIYGRKVTEEKRNELQLELLSSIAAQNTHGVVIADKDGKIEWANSSFEEMTEYKLEEMIGKKPGHLLQGPDSDQETIRYLSNQIATGEPFNCEILNYTKSKRPYWLKIQGQALKDRKGNVTKYFAIEEDITEKKSVDRKLEKQRTFYEQILNNTPADIAVFDNQHRYLFLNPQAISDPDLRAWMIGKKDEDYVNFKNLPMSRMEERRRIFNTILETKKLSSFEEEIKKADGSSCYILRNFYPVVNEFNDVELVVGYGVDITPIKEIQHKIEESEKKYRDVIENSLALISTHDMEGKLLSVNPKVGVTYGYSDNELIGHHLTEFIPKSDVKLFYERYLNKIKTDKQASGIFRVKSSSGKILYTLYNNFMKEEPGMDPYVISFAVDITERIQAEKELKIAKKATEELAKAKQNFLANMSHEIRTPMNAIIGMSNQLIKTDLSEKQKFYLNTMHRAADNLLVIINDILDLSKVEAGKLSIEEIAFEPKNIIENAIQVLMHKAEEKGIKLSNSIYDERISEVLIGDPYRINQILLNLISNAIKFTDKGSVEITCEAIDDTNEDQLIRIRIIDTGIGMDQEFVEGLFQKFTQEDVSVSRKFGGTGLGMTITKSLIQLMGGKIEVKSKKNEGTIVIIEVRLKRGKEEEMEGKEIIKIDVDRLIGRKILVVDDNEMNRLVASTILLNYRAEIFEAEDGREAVEIATNNNPEIILMDLQMPVLNGLDATKEIRSSGNDIPIIALTANAIRGENEKCINAGMNDYISKPFEENDLLRKIIYWLDKTSAQSKNTKQKNVSPLAESDNLYDISGLEKMSRGNEEFIIKMINIFCNQVPLIVDEMIDSYHSGDHNRMGALAHKIKPSLDNLKIESITEDIRIVEKAGKEGKTNNEIEQLLEKIKTIVDTVSKEMNRDYVELL